MNKKSNMLKAGVVLIVALTIILSGAVMGANFVDEETKNNIEINGTIENQPPNMPSNSMPKNGCVVFGLFPRISGDYIKFLKILPPAWHTIPKDKFTGHIGIFIIFGRSSYCPSMSNEEEINTNDSGEPVIIINYTVEVLRDDDTRDAKWGIGSTHSLRRDTKFTRYKYP